MGYLFLAISLLAGTTKGYCGKKTGGCTKSVRDAIFANILRMILCIVISLGIVFLNGDALQMSFSPKFLCICALSGVSTAVFVVTWLTSVRKCAYMMLDVFLMLGVVVTLILSNLFFGETIKYTQWFGMVLLFIAVFLMCSYNKSIKTKITVSSLAILILCGTANGLADFSQKLFVESFNGDSVATFNFYTYIFAAVSLIIAFIIVRPEEQNADAGDFKKMFWYILIMAICLFLNSYFKTLAAKYLSAILLYPLNQASALILSSVMSVVLLREKLTVKAVVGIVLAFIGLLIINLL